MPPPATSPDHEASGREPQKHEDGTKRPDSTTLPFYCALGDYENYIAEQANNASLKPDPAGKCIEFIYETVKPKQGMNSRQDIAPYYIQSACHDFHADEKVNLRKRRMEEFLGDNTIHKMGVFGKKGKSILPPSLLSPPPPAELPSSTVTIDVKSSKLPNDGEPVFLEFVLYNVEERIRLSESFYVDANSPEVIKNTSLGNTDLFRSTDPRIKMGRFTLPTVGRSTYKNIFFFIRGYRVFIGDSEKDSSHYKKDALSDDSKERFHNSIEKEVKACINKTPLQPYFYNYFRPFECNGKLYTEIHFNSCYFAKTSVTDEMVFDIVKEKSKPTKTLPVSIDIDINPPYSPQILVDNSMNIIQSAKEAKTIVKEVASFEWLQGSEQNVVTRFYNDLYIFPLSFSTKDKVYNYSISFVMLDIKDSSHQSKSFYNNVYTFKKVEASAREQINPALDYERVTSVQYREDNPLMCDEVKVRIPINFKEVTIVGLIKNITVGSSQGACIGCVRLDLADNERFIADGLHTLKVYSSLDELWTNHSSNEKKGRSLTIRTKLVSTIIARSDPIQSFFLSASKEMDRLEYSKLCSTPSTLLGNINGYDLVKFFPFIMHFLLQWFARNPTSPQVSDVVLCIMRMITEIQKNTDDLSQLLPMLEHFVNELFNPKKYLNSAGEGVHLAIAKGWKELIGERYEKELFNSAPYHWFLLDIVLKSVLVCASQRGVLDSDYNRRERFPETFSENVADIIRSSLTMVLKNVDSSSSNADILFGKINDFMLVIDRGKMLLVCYEFIDSILKRVTPKTEEKYVKIIHPLFTSFVQNPWFFHENFPVSSPQQYISQEVIENAPDTLLNKCPLAGLLIYFIEKTFHCIMLQNKALENLNTLMKVACFDSRLSTVKAQEAVSTILFPYVLMVLSNLDALTKEGITDTSLLWLRPFSCVVKNISEPLFFAWWDAIVPKTRIDFVQVLIYCSAKNLFYTAEDAKKIYKLVASILTNRQSDIRASFPLFKKLAELVFSAYNTVTESQVAYHLIPLISLVTENFAENFYSEQHDFFVKAAEQLMCLMNADDEETHEAATNAFVDIIVKAQKVYPETLESISSRMTIAVSELCGKDLQGVNIVQRSLKNAQSRFSGEQRRFAEEATEIVEAAQTLISNYKRLNDNKVSSNPETALHLLFEYTKSFLNSPDLLVVWLKNITEKLLDVGFFEEAAQCQLHLAYVYSLLLDKNVQHVRQYVDFTKVVPNLKELVPIIAKGVKHDTYPLTRVIEFTNEAFKNLCSQQLYELALQTSQLLTPLYIFSEKYTKLSVTMNSAFVMAKELDNTASQLRILARYYRVGFRIGSEHLAQLPELDGKLFIYKMPADSNLGTFTAYIKTFLLAVAKDESRLTLLSNNEQLGDPEPGNISYQIAAVEPYFDEEELLTTRKTFFMQNFDLRKFVMTQRLSPAKRASSDDISEQQSKKTIFTTAYSFPFVMRRIEVAEQKEVILSPIENAIEQVNDRQLKLKKQLLSDMHSVNQLQQVIQGIVLPMVNEGPLKICEVFLSNKTPENEAQKKLSASLCSLFNFCGLALQKDTEYSSGSKLHNTLQSAFEYYLSIHSFIFFFKSQICYNVFTFLITSPSHFYLFKIASFARFIYLFFTCI